MEAAYKSSKVKLPTLTERWKFRVAAGLLVFLLAWQLSLWRTESPAPESSWEGNSQVAQEAALAENLHTARSDILEEKPYTPEPMIFTIRAGDSLATIFNQAGLSPKLLHQMLHTETAARYLKKIYPGQVVRILVDNNNQFVSLTLDVDPLTALIISQHDEKLISHIENKPVEKRLSFGGAKISDSLFAAGKQANLDDALIMELAKVFKYDIDFAQDIRPNDHFKVIYEEHYVEGQKVANGPILAAEFNANGKQYQAIRYENEHGKHEYYTPSGQSLKTAFIRTPVQYTRISSHFNLKRLHPVLHQIRAHKGVDYAAPTGTPVKAAGNGTVNFVGKKGGYGNAIILQHGKQYTTLYGHLDRFAKNLKKGKTVTQGEVIGYVGSTGLASGPHLHFEFRINGVHHDPLTVAMPHGDGIPEKSKAHFLSHAKELLVHLEQQSKLILAGEL